MEGKEWAKWKVKTEKMQSYELLSGFLFFLAAIFSFWTILFLIYLAEDLMSYGIYAFDMPGVVDSMIGGLIATSFMILCFFGGMHYYKKAKEIEEEIEGEEE